MKLTRWRSALLLTIGLALGLPLNLLGSLRPIPVLALTWDASVNTSNVPTIWYTETSPAFDVTVTNTGTSTWPAGGTSPVRVAVYFTNENRDACTNCRYSLPYDVAPNGSATVHVQRSGPFEVGSYTLDINLVKETQFWFDTQTPNLPVALTVQIKVACGAYCTIVTNTNPVNYWRLNDHQGGAKEWDLNPKSAVDRAQFKELIQDISANPDRVVRGDFRNNPSATFYVRGDDVVVADSQGNFVTIMKGGVTNKWVQGAIETARLEMEGFR